MKKWLFPVLLLLANMLDAQPVQERLRQAVTQMEADPIFAHAIIGLSVADSKTGKTLYEHQSQTGLAPGSTQKIFTSCAAFDLLGKNYQYLTEIKYRYAKNNTGIGYLLIRSAGDPSFGSNRFASTRPAVILPSIITALRQQKINPVSLAYGMNDSFENNVPGGWIWEDIGNYYGAAAQQFNWMENEYDLLLKSGSQAGDTATIAATRPPEAESRMTGHLTTAEKGSGDNTIIYLPYGDGFSSIDGTIPVNENAFPVSASMANPFNVFQLQLRNRLEAESISEDKTTDGLDDFDKLYDSISITINLLTHLSPPFDSLNYWFLQKSINLYGEAFLKTMAFEKTGYGSTQKGVDLLKDFWAKQGIEKSSLHIGDGSGLSPQNRITTNALVRALQYAKTRNWFSSFYYDLPEHNGMKMKSGAINGARSYAGYQQSKNGEAYTFAIIVNNYDGPAGPVTKKIYALLDNLK